MESHLLEWARTADLARYPKHRHGPKKKKQPGLNVQFQNVRYGKVARREADYVQKTAEGKPTTASDINLTLRALTAVALALASASLKRA